MRLQITRLIHSPPSVVFVSEARENRQNGLGGKPGEGTKWRSGMKHTTEVEQLCLDAEQGHADAQLLLGLRYDNGLGVSLLRR